MDEMPLGKSHAGREDKLSFLLRSDEPHARMLTEGGSARLSVGHSLSLSQSILPLPRASLRFENEELLVAYHWVRLELSGGAMTKG